MGLRAQGIMAGYAGRLGVRVPRLCVLGVRGPLAWMLGNARAVVPLGVIVVRRDVLERHSEKALRFLLAHEVAHFCYPQYWLFVSLVVLVLLGVGSAVSLLPIGMVLVACAVIIGGGFVVQRELVADLMGARLAGERAYRAYLRECRPTFSTRMVYRRLAR